MKPHHIPTPPQLDRDPELAVLAALETTALSARFAVIAVHPAMRGDDFADPQVTERAAHAIVRLTEKLARAIADYRSAIDRDLADERDRPFPF